MLFIWQYNRVYKQSNVYSDDYSICVEILWYWWRHSKKKVSSKNPQWTVNTTYNHCMIAMSVPVTPCPQRMSQLFFLENMCEGRLISMQWAFNTIVVVSTRVLKNHVKHYKNSRVTMLEGKIYHLNGHKRPILFEWNILETIHSLCLYCKPYFIFFLQNKITDICTQKKKYERMNGNNMLDDLVREPPFIHFIFYFMLCILRAGLQFW